MRRLLAALLIAVAAGPGSAQEVGDAARGFAYATAICAECHAVELGDHDSPLYEAPPFQEIVEEPAMSEIALVVFFQTPHPTMPNLIVATADARDLIAYILSLRD